jgi:2-C-methyl-D-erythritol 2,4-cyclodiphosphate synthase
MDIRVGFGYDVHKLVEGRPLVVGGALVPNHSGSLGHSDGDVLIHAIMDAMLGAAGLRDIGVHFPDTDPSLKGIDSKILLERVMKLVVKDRYVVGNLDATVCLEKPKIAGFIPAMRTNLAAILNVDISKISIKATTSEGMGFIGRQEGITAYAAVLLIKKD